MTQPNRMFQKWKHFNKGIQFCPCQIAIPKHFALFFRGKRTHSRVTVWAWQKRQSGEKSNRERDRAMYTKEGSRWVGQMLCHAFYSMDARGRIHCKGSDFHCEGQDKERDTSKISLRHKNTTGEETHRNGIGQEIERGKSENSIGSGSFESSVWLHFTLACDIPTHNININMHVCVCVCVCVCLFASVCLLR